jgi:hypothetical protein
MAKTSEKIKITKTTVERALPYRYTDDIGVERVRQKVYFYTLTPGFGFVVGPGGAKSFFAQYSNQRKTVGRFGILTVDQARREAMTLLGRMAKGENIKETERRDGVKSITLRDATARYLNDLQHEDRSESTLHGGVGTGKRRKFNIRKIALHPVSMPRRNNSETSCCRKYCFSRAS